MCSCETLINRLEKEAMIVARIQNEAIQDFLDQCAPGLIDDLQNAIFRAFNRNIGER